MAPRQTTRSTADQETINATTVTNAQLQEMIGQRVTAALAARNALRSTNGDDSHNSGTGARRTERAAQMELWELKVKGTDLASYTQRFQGLALLCGRMFTKEADKETVNATTVTNAELQIMIDQGVTAALAVRDALRSTNGDDSHNSGTGARRTKRAARECTYTDFLKCQPLPFKVKFATCTLHSVALTWWNTHVQTVVHEVAYGMSWKTLMKMMTDKYCPRNEIKKLEIKLWELKVKGTDLASYTQRF
nr:keratin, type I cytoskeletal 9-like [Tanacetum cinerariifolium]